MRLKIAQNKPNVLSESGSHIGKNGDQKLLLMTTYEHHSHEKVFSMEVKAHTKIKENNERTPRRKHRVREGTVGTKGGCDLYMTPKLHGT